MKNNKTYTILLIFALISLFSAIFFVRPLLNEIKKSSKDLISAKNSMVALGAQINEIENFKKNYEIYKPDLAKIDQLFIDPDNPVDFFKFLEDTAASCQITSQISLPPYSQDPKQTKQNFIVFQFSSTGGFSEVLNFIKKIEAGPYLIEIENLAIQNPETSSEDKNVSKNDIYKNYSSRKVNATLAIEAFISPR